MRNFTLGKKGLPMILFALILLTTSFSSFAQENCPTVADTTQDFCYLATVSDLEATANGDAVRWYRTATSVNPIPENELLETRTYFAGNASGTCTTRTAVSVTVDNAGAPEPQFGNIFAPCVYGSTGADVKTVQDLINNIDGFQVEIYAEQFSGDPLPSSTPLNIGESYYAGQRNEDTGCPTSRVAIRYDPVFAPAPTAEPTQTFCEGATVADLEAQATSEYTQGFRWYSTATSQPPLSSSTELIDGETYYVSQIVNRDDRNEPPCESRNRFEVTVVVQGPVDLGEPATGIVCESDVQETFPDFESIENFYLSLLPEGTPTNGTFNPTAEEIAQIYQNDEDGLGDFTTTYTVGVDGCESSVEITITIVAEEEANAGTIEDIVVECEDEEIVILDDSILSEDATTGGTFTGEGVNEEGNFDPAIGPGTYTITYTVDDNADCVMEGTSDSTTFTITVQGTEELGQPIVMEMCITEVQALFSDPSQAEAFFQNILEENGISNFDGTFEPSEEVVGSEIYAYINSNPTAPATFNTTYTVTTNCGEESVDITLTINNTEEPNAGPINPAPVCSSATLFDLNTLLGDNNDAGGTFSDEDGVVENGLFDVSQVGEFEITYTVTASDENCTEGEDDSTTFTLTVSEGFMAESPAPAIVCESDVQATFPSVDEVRKFYIAIAQQAGFPTNGTLDPTASQLVQEYQADEDGLGDFTTTYTFGDGDCQTSVELTVRIVAAEEANAGTIEDFTVDCDSEELIVLADRLSDDATTGGTFSGEGVDADGNFDPSIGPGSYEITYNVDDSANCVIEGSTDSTTFTITVEGSFELGEPIVMEMCITDVEAMLTNPQAAMDLFNDALTENGIEDLDGEFSPALNVIAGQIAAYLNNPTPSQTFETTYSVSNECGEDSVLISLTINDTVAPNAGPINPAPVCSSATLFDLNTLLGDNNDAGGTFSDEDGVIENGLFDVSQVGEFEITYTVTASDENCTEGEDDSTTFTLTVSEGFMAESPAPAIVCESDVQATFPSVDEVRKFYIAIAQQAGFPTNGTLDPTASQLVQEYQADEDGLGDFTTTYTFGDGDCQTSVELTVRIVAAEEANAGTIEDFTVDCDSEELIVLADRLSDDATTGGTFSGEGVDADGNFDPSIGPGSYEITYNVDDSANCVIEGSTDSTTFTITVEGSVELGEPIVMEMCITDVEAMLTNPQAAMDLFNDALTENGIEDLDGEFSPALNVIAGQIAAYLNNPTPSQTFETTYSVSNECGEDSVLISLTINDVTEATTGEIEDFQVCSADGTINLYDRLTDANTSGGIFSDEDGEIVDGLFDVSQMGEFTVTYTVSEDQGDACVEGTASTQFTITVTDGITLENPAPGIVCESDVQATFPSNDEIRKFFVALLPAGVPTNGTLNPTPAQIAQMYQNDADGLGDFTTTYSVTVGNCVTTVQLTARIVAEEEATTGEITNIDVCLAEGNINLFDRLTDDNTRGGTFSTEDGELENGLLDVSAEGVFTITYTVSEEDPTTCLTGTASTEFTVTVSESSFDAGADNSREVCNSDVRNLSTNGVRNLFLGLLDEGVSTNGTFEPSINALINQYNMVSNYGDFTTIYTLGEGDCADSAVLTITVLEANDAGADMNLTFCATEGPVNLFDYLSAFASTNGTFSGLTDGMFDPSNAELGETEITYEVEDDESVCSTGNFTATFTINVVAPAPANAGGDVTVTYCLDQNENIQLNTLLGDDALMTGSFSAPYANGVFNPSNAGLGEFVITYTVDGAADCAIGTDSATITITVLETTATAPVADAAQAFCEVDDATVADLVATGEGLIWYLDADLETEADPTTILLDGAVYYVVSSTGDSVCETSDAVMVTVTINDSVSPTIQPEGNEFCRNDNPTVQDLIDNLNGDGIRIYSSATGGTALATSTALQNGVNYYATATNTTGCESSERRLIAVEVGFCGIPEGFSPNGDNINDRFVIPDIAEDYPNYTIEIFNRWGNVVFKGNARTPDWDGVSNQSTTLGDKVLPAGVYFYILNYNDGQTSPVQGKLYLSR
ncbi:gliding motility-associated C-terminal domain-containing protein [Antarcticibacterium arcticum]|uniref:Gliding motility-associated C-terminal domain-containing protein n=1 Tax=Antarcticibacterium arcticum TaxID=2585771 RepID=A0A5B8YLP5_9FLAO|nr:gliding motility-associated C-terminal domain-containing protein [Antarcticibacterium arcticum]QED38842.1 gliding motility-associated C-terminal domain-containing protein [Antarcticibacterium arcticum]